MGVDRVVNCLNFFTENTESSFCKDEKEDTKEEDNEDDDDK